MTAFTLIFCLSGLVFSVHGSQRLNRHRQSIIKEPRTPWNFRCKVMKPSGNRTWPRANSPPAAWHQAGQQPRMLPVRIEYVLLESTRENAFLMQDQFQRLNAYLGELIKTDPLVMDAMMYSYGMPGFLCDDSDFARLCGHATVPEERLEPCTNQPIQGVSTYPSEHLKLLESKDISLIVYVKVFDPKYPGIAVCDDTLHAYSMYCMWNANHKFRLIHGLIMVCKKLTDYDPDHLFKLLLHETIHLLTGGSLQGYRSSEYGVGTAYIWEHEARKEDLLNTTWQKTTYNWTMQDGTKKGIDVEFASTPNVMRAVKEYFRCFQNSSRLLGAEVGLLKNNGSDDYRTDEGHWSQRLFPDEILSTLVKGPDAVVSNLTLAVLKDTRWYEVNMSMAQPMEFDASRTAPGQKEYCHLAWDSCWDVLKDVSDKWLQNPNVLEFAGPYCDPTGAVSTRACSSDGRLRLQCLRSEDEVPGGCAIYVKNATMDIFKIDCMGQERTWEEIAARERMGAYAYPAMCLSFTKYTPATSMNELINYPGCYEFNCTTESKAFDFHVFTATQQCSVRKLCGVGKPSVTRWPSSCPFPYTGSVVCPDYVNVCEKPDGVGAINWTDRPAERGVADSEDTSVGSTVHKGAAGILSFMAMCLAY